MCGIVVALPAYGGPGVEQPDLTSLVDLSPSLPDLDGFGGDRDKLGYTLHMAAERLAVAVDAYATTGAVLTLANTVDGDPLRRALHQLECTGAELDEGRWTGTRPPGAPTPPSGSNGCCAKSATRFWTCVYHRVAAAARARAQPPPGGHRTRSPRTSRSTRCSTRWTGWRCGAGLRWDQHLGRPRPGGPRPSDRVADA